jgi:hypothetical protein
VALTIRLAQVLMGCHCKMLTPLWMATVSSGSALARGTVQFRTAQDSRRHRLLIVQTGLPISLKRDLERP